jgi:hypothetical protein
MNENEIEISNKAFTLAHRLQTIAPQMSSLVDLSKQVSAACLEYSNSDITPDGYNIDPINGTPFYVVYRPNEDGEIHGIYCRGVEVTDYLTGCTLELASQIAVEAVADEETANEEWSAEQRFEVQRLGE